MPTDLLPGVAKEASEAKNQPKEKQLKVSRILYTLENMPPFEYLLSL